MKNGVVEVIKQRVSWPPNLPKFLDLASGVDTDEAFDRMIRHGKTKSDVEIKVWAECAFQCRTRLSEDKARALFKKTYLKWRERSDSGQMPPMGQKALPANSANKKSDHDINERIRLGLDKQRGKR